MVLISGGMGSMPNPLPFENQLALVKMVQRRPIDSNAIWQFR
jgi:hypothetical protein